MTTKTKENAKTSKLTPREKQFTPLPADEASPDKMRLVMQQAGLKALAETRKGKIKKRK